MIRGLHSAGLSARTHTSHILPAVAPTSAIPCREYHGDPGPSTIQRQNRFAGRAGNSYSSQDRPPRLSSPSDGPGERRRDFGYRAPRPRPFVPAGPQQHRDNRGPRPGPRPSNSPGSGAGRKSPNFYMQNVKPQDRPTGHQGDVFETSSRVTAWIKAHPSPVKPADLDSLLDMLMDAPKSKVNAVVWNQVLGLLGREGKMDRLWKVFNDMKKRGIEPTSRTYTTMINAYSGVPHLREDTTFVPMKAPQERVFQRIIGIYNQSQQHISECIRRISTLKAESAEGEGAAEGISTSRINRLPEDHPLIIRIRQNEEEISLGPTNAYLKYLGRFGLWSEIDKIHVAMDKDGPLSPDNVTYSILFSGLLNRMAQQHAKKFEAARAELPSIMSKDEFGDRVRTLWDEAVKSFHPPPRLSTSDSEINKLANFNGRDRRIDEGLACLALSAFLRARPSEERLAISLIPFLWNLPEPQATIPAVMPASSSATAVRLEQPRPDRDVPPLMRNIPVIPLTIRAAGSITTMLNRAEKATVAAHFARHFLADRALRPHLDFSFIRSAIHALSLDGDAATITKIFDQYQPTTGRDGWPTYVWDNALTATRWSSEFPTALTFFRRMTHIPHGIEEALPISERNPYIWKAPHGHATDITGKRFIKPDPVTPTAKTLSLLFKTAFGSGESLRLNVKKAFNIYSIYRPGLFFTIDHRVARIEKDIDLLNDNPAGFKEATNAQLIREAEWKLSLAKDIVKACDIMLETAKAEEKVFLQDTMNKMWKIGQTWGQFLDPKTASKRKALARGKEASGAYGASALASVEDGGQQGWIEA